MILGDVYQYKDEYLDGIETDNYIVIATTDNYVICTVEKFFSSKDYFSNISNVTFNLPLRKIDINKFKAWYPKFLYNING